MFCATAPAVAAMGVGMRAKQQKERKTAEACGEKSPKPKVLAGPATVLALMAVFVVSAIIHSNN
jgi:hypothetical protein